VQTSVHRVRYAADARFQLSGRPKKTTGGPKSAQGKPTKTGKSKVSQGKAGTAFQLATRPVRQGAKTNVQ